jgi:signal transduction histidine kinase
MRAVFAVTGVALLALALTSLSLRSVNADAEMFDKAIAELDQFTKSEGALRGDLLAARAGLLRNYDPVVQQVNATRASLDNLRDIATGEPQVLAAIEQLSNAVGRQEQMVEQFKSDNALLQNSLTHFARIGRSFQRSDRTATVPQINAIIANVLHLTLDTSPGLLRETQNLLDDAATAAPVADADQMGVFLDHARMLVRLLPQMDAELKSITSCVTARDALRTIVLNRQKASRDAARHYRFLLYGTSLLLAGALIFLVLCLQARAVATRRRAALESTVAAISTRFINATPRDTDAGIDQALAELARCVGAERAYFMSSGECPRTHLWCGPGISAAPGWPRQAPELAAQFGASVERVVQVVDVRRLWPGAKKEACLAAELRGWAFASSMSARGPVFLGFDAVTRPCGITHPGELGVLPMALDLLAHAVERQTTELEKSSLEERLQQTRRMETVGALASGVAHNFNNIIAAILGYVELAEAQVTKGSRPARHLSGIRRAGERGRDVVEQLLRFGRRRSGRHQLLDVRCLMAESESFLRASLPREIDLAFHEVPMGAGIVAEPAQLQQVILNLCSNAAQAMEGRGHIKVETMLHELADIQDLTHGTLRPGRYVVLAVTDSGPGMDRVVLENLFEPFFTTRTSGNGLGLATVREIVDEHGGAINVSSTPRKGSRFEVWLPCRAAGQRVMDGPTEEAFGRGQTVLLLSSSSEQLLHDEEILAALGYEPVGFWRAADAVTACRSNPDRFDAILIGCSLLEREARSLPALLHRIEPRLPIVVAAEPTEIFDVDALVMAGVSEVVTRPMIADEIAAVLARCLQAKIYHSATATYPADRAAANARVPMQSA